MSTPITSKGFTIYPQAKENEPSKIEWEEGGQKRQVEYLVRSTMGVLKRWTGLDPQAWICVGTGDKAVYLSAKDLARFETQLARDAALKKLTDFFTTTFQEAIGAAKKVQVKVPELGRDVVEKEAKKIKSLVKSRLIEMVAAARSSPKHTSKLQVSDTVGVIRCQTTETGDVTLSATKKGGKGTFKTVLKMIDFGAVEQIADGNKVYAYLKLHKLDTLSPEEAEDRIALFREEIEVLEELQTAGVENTLKLFKVKYEQRTVGGKQVEVPIGIMVEWCNLGDAEWITRAPPRPGSPEYDLCLKIAHDAAVGMNSIQQKTGYVHGDIKNANLFLKMINGRISAVWGDLGGCTTPGEKLKTPTPAFLAPEQLWGPGKGVATTAGEMWAFGIFLLRMFHGKDSNAFLHVVAQYNLDRQMIEDELKDVPADKKAELRKQKLAARHSQLKQELRDALQEVKSQLVQGNPVDDLIIACLRGDATKRPSAEEAVKLLAGALPPPPVQEPKLSAKAQAQRTAAADKLVLGWRARATPSRT